MGAPSATTANIANAECRRAKVSSLPPFTWSPPLSYLLHGPLTHESLRSNEKNSKKDQERHGVLVAGADDSNGQRFQHAECQASEDGPDGTPQTPEDGSGEPFESYHRARTVAHEAAGSDQNSPGGRDRGAHRETDQHDARVGDTHQAGRLGIDGAGPHRLPGQRPPIKEL